MLKSKRALLAALAICGLLVLLTMSHAQPANPPDATAQAVRSAASDADAFALDLYARLASDQGNLFFSPYSISSALAMTYGGARGNTATQMARVMHFSLPSDQLHPAYAQLIPDLNQGGNVKGKQAYELVVANAIWGQRGFPYQPAFVDLLTKQYAAGLHEVDFLRAAEQSRGQINDWVAHQTKDKIKDLLGPGTVQSDTRLVLTNAIYFKGAWNHPFEKSRTKDQPFHGPGAKTSSTPMMHEQEKFAYAENEDLQAVELPYAGNKLSMLVLLPRKADGLAVLEKKLTRENLDGWLGKLRSREVRLDLPKFKTEHKLQLGETLKAMGMTDAFSPNKADFSGIATAERLMIDKVIHQAFVDVNEEGTEAAAATGVTMRPTAVRIEDPPVDFRADHPFVFLIRHRESGAIVFLGRIVEPGA